jgi:outer membrane protein
MKRLCVLGAVLLLATATASAQTRDDLSLSQAVETAIRNQPLMRAAQLGVDLADKRVTEARKGHLPTLQMAQTVALSNNPVFVFGSLLEQGRFGLQNFALTSLNNPDAIMNVRTAVSANLAAFDGMKTSAKIDEANIVRDQAVFSRTLAEQRIRFEVLQKYFGVLVAIANRQAADDAVRLSESDLNRTQDRLDAGLAVESDRLAAQVQLAEFTQQHIASEGALATALVSLNVASGFPPQTQHDLTGRLSKKRFPISSQDELVQRAMLHRADYAQAGSGIKFAERQAREKHNDYLPQLNVFGSFGASGHNWTTGSTDYTVGAGVTLNLFDPGRVSRINQAQIQQDIARTERDRLRDQIVVEVAKAYYQYRAAVQQVEVAEAALSQAAEALRIIQDRYEAGLTTISDLLRAETTLVRARTNLTSATEAQYVGFANVLLAVGELNDVGPFES